jgi:anti-sigma regulatory factor (Ser/Thr protein kinase)
MPVQTRTFGANKIGAAAIDDWITDVGRQWGKSPRTVFAARLCVAELAANAIEHGVARSNDDHIVVTLQASDDGIGIEFMDTMEPFDPTAVAAPKPESSPDPAAASVGGRGLMLIRAYSEDLAYRYDGRYNRVTLKIRLA